MWIIRVRPSSEPSASITGEQSNVRVPSRSKRFSTQTTPSSRAFAANASTVGPGTGSAWLSDSGPGGVLRIERLERQLGKTDDLCAAPRRRLEGAQPARQVFLPVVAGVLLDHRDAHEETPAIGEWENS